MSNGSGGGQRACLCASERAPVMEERQQRAVEEERMGVLLTDTAVRATARCCCAPRPTAVSRGTDDDGALLGMHVVMLEE